MICGENTTTQQAIEMEPVMPLRAAMSTLTIKWHVLLQRECLRPK